jgi:hypothetical protein
MLIPFEYDEWFQLQNEFGFREISTNLQRNHNNFIISDGIVVYGMYSNGYLRKKNNTNWIKWQIVKKYKPWDFKSQFAKIFIR